MKEIAVFLAEGFEEIEAITIIDVLRRASFNVKTISASDDRAVTGSHAITVSADFFFEEVDFKMVDMIVLPGGMPGSKNLGNHEGLKNLILNFNRSGKYLGAICAAPLVFGQLGILDGKKATCYPGFESHLKGANITSNDIEVSGNIITGKGAGAAMKFALKIVELISGKESAEQLAHKMIFEY